MNPFLTLSAIVLAPLVGGAALVGLAAARRLGLAPKGVSTVVAVGFLISLGYTAIFAIDWVNTCCVQPAAIQRELFGRVVATPLDLRSVRRTGFQDIGIDRVYALDRKTLEEFRRHCEVDPNYPAGCNLASRTTGSALHHAEISNRHLVIRDWDL